MNGQQKIDVYLINEFLKASDYLTLDESNRLRERMIELTEGSKNNEYMMKGKLEELTKRLENTDRLVQSLIDAGQVRPKN
jgi:hypothetical protein